MTPNNEIKRILFEHEAWLNGSGVRADLRGANLCDANLRRANLCGANLCGADLCGADLRGIVPTDGLSARPEFIFMTRGETVNYD